MSSPVARFQSLMVLSALPVAKVVPSGLKHDVIDHVVPLRAWSFWPVATFQSLMVRSACCIPLVCSKPRSYHRG